MEKKKIVHQLDTPYSAVQWPSISQEDQDTILELLCNLLAPLGQHRKLHQAPSKGKRSRPKKRKLGEGDQAEQPIPPAPEVAAFVDIGLARITRALEKRSSQKHTLEEQGQGKEDDDKAQPPSYSIVFIARSGQPSALHNHLPQMVAVASDTRHHDAPTRLVGFSKACEDRLSSCLGIPRVSSIALREGAPQSKPLIDFVRNHVSPIEVQWLQEARNAEFRETKINSVQTTVGTKRQKKP